MRDNRTTIEEIRRRGPVTPISTSEVPAGELAVHRLLRDGLDLDAVVAAGRAIGIALPEGQADLLRALADLPMAKLTAVARAIRARTQAKTPAATTESQLNGGRNLPFDRDTLGRMVREAWVRWALTQPNPKPSWLISYEHLEEADKEADRQIGEAVARWVLIGDAACFSTQADAPAPTVIDEIAAERRRQIEVEGWTPEHDDQHIRGELAAAAACYAHFGWMARRAPTEWPWDPAWWKPKDRRRDLIRSAALIVAEIERLDRTAPAQPEGGGRAHEPHT